MNETKPSGPALGLGHLGHGLRPPNMGKAPKYGGSKCFFFFFSIKEKCELSAHFFPKA